MMKLRQHIFAKYYPRSLEPGLLSFGYSANIITCEHKIERELSENRARKIAKN